MEKKAFIKQWMKTYDPDTFKAGENGRYFYRSEDLSSGIDLECFFEDLLTDFESALAKETEQQSNCNLPDVSNCPDLTNVWYKILEEHADDIPTRDKFCDALWILEAGRFCQLKFAI